MLIDLEDFFKYTKLDIKRKSKVLLSFKETEKGTSKKGQRKIFNQSPRSNLDYPSLYAVLSGDDDAQCCVLSGHCFF